jgi:hypothetical protein
VLISKDNRAKEFLLCNYKTMGKPFMVTFTKAGLIKYCDGIMAGAKHGHHDFDKNGLNLLGVIL